MTIPFEHDRSRYVARVASQEWPPTPGKHFNTCILSWCYDDASFWRGNAIAMSEVVGYSRSMALTRFREAPVAVCACHGIGFDCHVFGKHLIALWPCVGRVRQLFLRNPRSSLCPNSRRGWPKSESPTLGLEGFGRSQQVETFDFQKVGCGMDSIWGASPGWV